MKEKIIANNSELIKASCWLINQNLKNNLYEKNISKKSSCGNGRR
jgi:hypothetical protein